MKRLKVFIRNDTLNARVPYDRNNISTTHSTSGYLKSKEKVEMTLVALSQSICPIFDAYQKPKMVIYSIQHLDTKIFHLVYRLFQ